MESATAPAAAGSSPLSRLRPNLFPLLLLWVVCTAGGCIGLSAIPRPLTSLEPEPYLVHFPGIGGATFFHKMYLQALRTGGFDAEIHLHDWSRGRFPIVALQDYERNRRLARAFAARLTERHRRNPERPIYLSSESGGTGMLLWVLEELPDDVQVDVAVLIAPAVSPDYDLTPALRRVRKRMLVFQSPNDWFILGVGTNLFGTMDGVKTDAAGRVGFRMPAGADPRQYEKLTTFRYAQGWRWTYGYGGGHFDCLAPRFASGFIAPLLTDLATPEPIHTPARSRAKPEPSG